MLKLKRTICRSLLVLSLFAPVAAMASTILFAESFTDNSNGWNETAGWNVNAGVYQYRSGTDFLFRRDSFIPFGALSASDLTTGSYQVSYDMRFLQPWVGFASGLSWQDGVSSDVNWNLSSKEYSNVQFVDQPAGVHIDDATQHFATGQSFNDGQWYHYDLLFDQGLVSVFWDGVLLFDGPITGQWSNGTVGAVDMDMLGFSVWRTNADFDNLVITDLSVASVPLPATVWLLGLAVFGMIEMRRRSARALAA